VDITGSKEKITQIKKVVNIYKSVNTYNCNKTSLFWLQTPDNTLATKAQSNSKKKKNRIIIHVTTNVTGTYKLNL